MLKYLFLILFTTSLIAQTGQVMVTWDANSESDLAGYYIYIWDSTKVTILPDSVSQKYLYFKPLTLINAGLKDGNGKVKLGKVTNFVWNALAPVGATFYTGISAYDKSGNESMATTIKFKLKETDIVAPSPPGGVSIVNIVLGFFGIAGIVLIVFLLRQKR